MFHVKHTSPKAQRLQYARLRLSAALAKYLWFKKVPGTTADDVVLYQSLAAEAKRRLDLAECDLSGPARWAR